MCNFEVNDLSIMPSPSNQFGLLGNDREEERYKIGGINFTYVTSCRISNVVVSGLYYPAINNIEAYDCNWNNLQIMGSGNINDGSVTFLPGTSDGCNAIHIDGCRFEKSRPFTIKATNLKFQREFQVSNCKFEGSGININGSSDIIISDTHFTFAGIHVTKTDSTESYGIKIIGCNFLNIDSSLTSQEYIPIYVIGCTFKNSFNVDCNRLIMTDTLFYGCNNNRLIKLNDRSTISGCFFSACSKSGIDFFGLRNKMIDCNQESGEVFVEFKDGATSNICDRNYGFDYNGGKAWEIDNFINQFGNISFPHHLAERFFGAATFDYNTNKLKIVDGTGTQVTIN